MQVRELPGGGGGGHGEDLPICIQGVAIEEFSVIVDYNTTPPVVGHVGQAIIIEGMPMSVIQSKRQRSYPGLAALALVVLAVSAGQAEASSSLSSKMAEHMRTQGVWALSTMTATATAQLSASASREASESAPGKPSTRAVRAPCKPSGNETS